jgi:hypothetical protein
MNPTDTITLTAFLAALTQLDSPLPPEVQTQLKNVASVDDITANIGQLNAIAQNYPDLDEHYQNAREILQLPVSERSKGPLPKINHLTEREITEITNIAREVANSPEPINAANQATQKSSFLKQLRDCLKTCVNG